MKELFRALRSRNYRFFFVGQGISLIGSWLTRIAMSWLVYRLTNSALLLGVVGFSSQILTFVFTPLAGVLVDRWERRSIVLLAQIGLMVHAFTLAALTFLGIIEVWHIIALSVLQGLFVAFDTPSRQSFVVDMVERREDVPNAIALNSAVFQGARFIGPSVGGVLIALSNEGVCFLIDGISYIAVIIALLLMHIPKKILQENILRVTDELIDGFHYAFSSLPIRAILLLIVVVSLFGMPYATLMPIVAKEILGGGPQTLGFLMASSGVGAMAAALLLASRKSVRGLGKYIPRAVMLFGCGLIAVSFSTNLYLSMGCLFFGSFGALSFLASSNTILQTIVDENKRGRILSLYAMAFLGMAPFGNLLAGYVAETIGVLSTLLTGGITCIIGAFVFARHLPSIREDLRPIYIAKGIIEE